MSTRSIGAYEMFNFSLLGHIDGLELELLFSEPTAILVTERLFAIVFKAIQSLNFFCFAT